MGFLSLFGLFGLVGLIIYGLIVILLHLVGAGVYVAIAAKEKREAREPLETWYQEAKKDFDKYEGQVVEFQTCGHIFPDGKPRNTFVDRLVGLDKKRRAYVTEGGLYISYMRVIKPLTNESQQAREFFSRK